MAKEAKLTFEEQVKDLEKSYGKGSVIGFSSSENTDYDVVSTGSIAFDNSLGVWGICTGKMYELMGWEGCLAEDTFIKFINVRKDGVVQDCKGGTIKNLYERFHNRTELTKDTTFNVTSINEEDKVFRNEIADVVKSGVKECFELTTKKGFKIKATKDHKFYVGNKYLPLSDLSEGDVVFVHTNTPHTNKEVGLRKKYKETTLKYYYKGKQKEINGSLYYREKVHRLTYEAYMNNLTYEEYVSMLNSFAILEMIPQNLWTIPEGYEVHHIDENTENNNIDNLQLIAPSEHARIHALKRHNNLRFIVMPDEIVSITSVGEMETYDIKCYFPYNNFIAEGIVVHNSGKTTICGHIVANFQKKFPDRKVVYIDAEHALDKEYFSKLGVDIDKMYISQPDYGEMGFNIAEKLIDSGEVSLCIIDSNTAMLPKKVIDGDAGDSALGLQARLNSQVIPKIKNKLIKNNATVILISQFREKIGVMFGSPVTTNGGHALKFYADVRIEVSKSLDRENEGNKCKVKITKNKMAPPFVEGEFFIKWGVGIDKTQEIIDLGNQYEILKKWGKTITLLADEDVKLDTKYDIEEFTSVLEDNEEFRNNLVAKIKEKIKNHGK